MFAKKWVKILVGVMAVALLAVAYGYWTVGRPLLALGKGMAKMADGNDSVEIKYQTPDNKVSLMGEVVSFERENALSRVKFEMDGLSVESRVGKTDLFVQADYSDLPTFEKTLMTMDPMLARTMTYKSLAPMLSGKSWMHVPLPEKWWESEDESKEEVSVEMSKADQAKFGMNVIKTVKIKSYDKKSGRIVIALRKKGMLDLIEELKDMDVEIKLSQINAIKRVVESSDDWDGDLLEFWLDKEGRLVKIVARIPEIDEKVMSDSLKEGLKDQQGVGQAASGMSERFAKMIGKSNGAKYVELGSVTFDKFGQVVTPEMPTETVEWAVWSKTAMAEFGPLIMQVMGSALGQPQNPGMMRKY